jgi:cytochrome bd-type quinol oxidase subunit 2
MSTAVRFALTLILVHLLVMAVHGQAHQRLGIMLDPWQKVFVAAVILAAPLLAGLLLWKGSRRAGGWLLVCSMAGALAFGAYYHFAKESPDHVSRVAAMRAGAWGVIFQTTAGLLAITEVLGCWAAIATLRSLPKGNHR